MTSENRNSIGVLIALIGTLVFVILCLIQKNVSLEYEIRKLTNSGNNAWTDGNPLILYSRQLRSYKQNDTNSQAASHHRNIFIDLGSNSGDSLLSFLGLIKDSRDTAGNGAKAGFYGIGMNGTWDLYAVEPIPRLGESLNRSRDLVMSKCTNVHSYTVFTSTAMSNRDGTAELVFDAPKEEFASYGTSLYNQTRHGDSQGVTVKVLDIATFLKNSVRAKRSDNVIIKLDIENAEYDVLRRLYTSGLIKLVDRLFIEFHQFFPNAQNAEDKANRDKPFEMPKQCLLWMLEDTSDVKWEEWG